MWTDTHCHLDAGEFGGASDAIARQAGEQGVAGIVIPAVDRHNFAIVRDLARRQPNCAW
jgi:TatD DNase family protein